MKDIKNLFDSTPPSYHSQNILREVEKLLSEKRLQQRRRALAWLAVPALASFFGLYVWRKQESPQMDFLASEDMLQTISDENNMEMIADLDLLENLDTLEKWNGKDETGS